MVDFDPLLLRVDLSKYLIQSLVASRDMEIVLTFKFISAQMQTTFYSPRNASPPSSHSQCLMNRIEITSENLTQNVPGCILLASSGPSDQLKF